VELINALYDLYLRRSCIEPAESDPVIHKQTSTNHIAAAIYCAGHKRNLQIIEKVRCVLFDLWPFVAPARGMIAHRLLEPRPAGEPYHPDSKIYKSYQRGRYRQRSISRVKIFSSMLTLYRMYLSKYFNAENICDDFFSFLIYVRVDKRNVVIASHAVA